MEKIHVFEKFGLITGYWDPKIISELNGQEIKLVKFAGEFVWHHHVDEDEAFLVFKGSFTMQFRDKAVRLSEGDMIVVPRGVDHRPVSDGEVWVMLFEPSNTLNTGNVTDEKTKIDLERI